jgi:hypothetical protein
MKKPAPSKKVQKEVDVFNKKIQKTAPKKITKQKRKINPNVPPLHQDYFPECKEFCENCKLCQ